jgi:hypothetical protein
MKKRKSHVSEGSRNQISTFFVLVPTVLFKFFPQKGWGEFM